LNNYIVVRVVVALMAWVTSLRPMTHLEIVVKNVQRAVSNKIFSKNKNHKSWDRAAKYYV